MRQTSKDSTSMPMLDPYAEPTRLEFLFLAVDWSVLGSGDVDSGLSASGLGT